MRAEGVWAWWNSWGSVPLATCLARAKQVRGVIVKAGYWQEFAQFKAVNRVAVERYVYPNNVQAEVAYLADGISRGAEFAVLNAEAEWEAFPTEQPMMDLINALRARCPGVELYASIDSRGDRTRTPCLAALIRECAGVFVELYPKAFRPSMPPGAVAAAFVDSIDHGDFQGKPVLPSLQTYDGIGAQATREQIAQCVRDRYQGWQAYTLAHATDEEWAAFVAASAPPIQEEEDMKPYLVREKGSPYVYICAGATISYLRRLEHATAMGIDPAIKVVPDGTLASYTRLDALPFQYLELLGKVDAIKKKVEA